MHPHGDLQAILSLSGNHSMGSQDSVNRYRSVSTAPSCSFGAGSFLLLPLLNSVSTGSIAASRCIVEYCKGSIHKTRSDISGIRLPMPLSMPLSMPLPSVTMLATTNATNNPIHRRCHHQCH